MRLFLLPLLTLLLGSAFSREKTGDNEARASGPSGTSADIPQLETLLQKGGWTPTPEMSGRYEVGTILDTSMGDHRITARGCFERPPVYSPYIGAEIVGSMQAGVSVSSGFGAAKASASLVKKVKFGTPTTASLERLYMKVNSDCLALLEELDPGALRNMYIVQEVLKAEIAEQTCGKINASGKFVLLGEADAEYAQACAQESLEPVAIGYRTLPLAEVLPAELRVKVQALSVSPNSIPDPVTPAPSSMNTSNSDALSSSPDQNSTKSEYAGSHFGAYLGAFSGVRYQWRGREGEVAVGGRLEVGPAFLTDCCGVYAAFQVVPEVELRRKDDSFLALLISAPLGYPIYYGAGGGVVVGRATGLRAEAGASIGFSIYEVQANVGWVW